MNTQRNKATGETTPQNQEHKTNKNEINHNTQNYAKKETKKLHRVTTMSNHNPQEKH
jgi:hypothetical protein